MSHSRRILIVVLALLVVTIGPVLAEDDEPPPVYELSLVYLFDGPETEFILVIGNSGFRSVASLKDFLVSRPAGTTLRWAPGCIRMEGEPLLSSETDMEEFKAFCLEHHIVFELLPSG